MSDKRAEPCKSTSISNGLTLSISIVLVASYTPSYSPHLTCSHTRHVLLTLILATSYSLSSLPPASYLTLYSSLCIVQLPGVSVTLRAALTMPQSLPSYSPRLTCSHTHRILLALILAISYLLSSSLLASSSPSSS